MNTERLKALNKPENLMESYNLKLPFYAIPPEALQDLIFLLAEIAKYQEPLQKRINELPGRKDLSTLIQRAMAGQINNSVRALQRDIHGQTDTLKKGMDTIAGRLRRLEKTLQSPRKEPWELRLKWAAIGAAVPVMLWGLWTLLKA